MVLERAYETDAAGNVVGVPTNLKVDSAGNVYDAAGNIVGRAGEVFVDGDGNAVNAAGQVVGYATAATTPVAATNVGAEVVEPITPVEPALHYAPVHTSGVYPVGAADLTETVDPAFAQRAAEVIDTSDFYHDRNGGILRAPTNLTVDGYGNVMNAGGVQVGKAGEIFVDANGNAININGQRVGEVTEPIAPIIATGRAPAVVAEPAELDDGTRFGGQRFAPYATEGLAEPVGDGTTADAFVNPVNYPVDDGAVINPAVGYDGVRTDAEAYENRGAYVDRGEYVDRG
ncbi:MAG: DUF3659 domain-containing protein, partial [Promicromonosporaceae bacterium]|nr:DUF3659 domain-containing protein [Promicromonosporaceae bacterium]